MNAKFAHIQAEVTQVALIRSAGSVFIAALLVFLFIATIGAPRSAYADEMQPLQSVIDTEALSTAGMENEELKLQGLKLYRARMTQVLRNVRKTEILSEVDIDELNSGGWDLCWKEQRVLPLAVPKAT